jgi:hypothetical protein
MIQCHEEERNTHYTYPGIGKRRAAGLSAALDITVII